jgi:hypothetical protein
MPADFDKCVKDGGRVRRVSGPDKDHGLEEGEYVNYCFHKGQSYRGEVKKTEKKDK